MSAQSVNALRNMTDIGTKQPLHLPYLKASLRTADPDIFSYTVNQTHHLIRTAGRHYHPAAILIDRDIYNSVAVCIQQDYRHFVDRFSLCEFSAQERVPNYFLQSSQLYSEPFLIFSGYCISVIGS